MLKDNILNFINKYNLDSSSSRGDTPVIITASDSKLAVQFKSEDATILGKIVAQNIDLPDGKYGVFNTSTLLALCKLMQNEFDINVLHEGDAANIPTKLILSDSSYRAEFILADLDIIPSAESRLLAPEYDVVIEITPSIIDRYVKSLAALPAQFVAFRSKKGRLELIINYSSQTSNTIILDLGPDNSNALIAPLVFNASRLKDILLANKDLIDGKISFCQNFAELIFKSETIMAKYYISSIID